MKKRATGSSQGKEKEFKKQGLLELEGKNIFIYHDVIMCIENSRESTNILELIKKKFIARLLGSSSV